jgi:antitoxin component of MazEF toxin-antitoxin module
MEIRKLYKQGKSLVLVIPSKYLEALEWDSKDHISLSLLPDKSIKLTKVDNTQPLLII